MARNFGIKTRDNTEIPFIFFSAGCLKNSKVYKKSAFAKKNADYGFSRSLMKAKRENKKGDSPMREKNTKRKVLCRFSLSLPFLLRISLMPSPSSCR